MTDHAERRAQLRQEVRRRYRKQRWENRLVTLLAALGGLGALLGMIALFAVIGSISIYIGWNLGVYGLAHAVHADVLRIDYPTAFGAALAIRALRSAFAAKISKAP